MRVITSEPFQVSKAGNSPGEGDDRVELPKSIRQPKRRFHVAIADGATESAFSGLWAQKLVSAYVSSNRRKPPTPKDLFKMIEENAPLWSAEVWAKPLPWFAQAKVQHGAFSTLLGFYLEDKPEETYAGFWSVLAVGDTCIFQIRADELITCFPIERADQFGSRPVLIFDESHQQRDSS